MKRLLVTQSLSFVMVSCAAFLSWLLVSHQAKSVEVSYWLTAVTGALVIIGMVTVIRIALTLLWLLFDLAMSRLHGIKS